MPWTMLLPVLLGVQTLASTVSRNAGGYTFPGGDKLLGVNLGGWLVLEPWITPSIFQTNPPSFGVVDEYTLGQKLVADAASSVLKQHWDTFIQESDLQQIAQWGFNTVRIPIGFWAFNTFGTPYVSGAAPYLDKALSWAKNAGLKVIIDLHGAPLSQNGFDNSGQRLPAPGWGQGDSVAQTLQVLKQMSDRYAKSPAVLGIELLNEPLSPKLNMDQLHQFYRDGYGRVREDNLNTIVILEDAFVPLSSWNGFLTPSDANAQNVAMDHHEYQVFDNTMVGWTPSQHRQGVCNNVQNYAGSDKWSFVGEWTAAMTDCAAALNGYGLGARYDGSFPGSTYHGSCGSINFIDTWNQTLIDDTRAYIEAQMDAFESKTNGWVFWTYKTEASAEWDLGRLIKVGAFPQPLSRREFAQACLN